MERDAKRMLLEYNKETKRLDDLYRCAAKQCGISECAFWILYTLRAEKRQFTQAEICEFLIEPKQTVHSALKKLEAEGYLARTSSANLRSKHVALTERVNSSPERGSIACPRRRPRRWVQCRRRNVRRLSGGCICSAGCWRKGSARTAQFKG